MTTSYQERGRRGYLAFVANNGIGAARDRAALASRSFRESFLQGHGCSLCPRVILPAELSPEDRATRAQALWDLHWIRLRAARDTRKRLRATA